MPIRRHSPEELEAIASEFLSKNAKGHYDGDSLRIEPLIEQIGYSILPIKGLGEVAEAYLPLKEGLILIDEDQCGPFESLRYRFTLAEELAHIILHRPLFQGKTLAEVTQIQNEITDAEYRAIEKEAKHLAGALLMQKERFVPLFRHFEEAYAQQTNRIRLLKTITRKLFYAFNVSYSSVCLRAICLGLVEQEDLPELLPVSFGNSN